MEDTVVNFGLDESDYEYMLENQIVGSISEKDEQVEEFAIRNQNISINLRRLNDEIRDTLLALDKSFTTFSIHFTKEIEGKKVQVKNKISKVLLKISKEKLPEIYLRSIPKFKGNQLTAALHTTLLKMKRIIDRNERNNIVRYDQELKNEVIEQVKLKIGENYIDPRNMMHHLVMKTEDVINDLKNAVEKLNSNLLHLKKKNYQTITSFKNLKMSLKKKGGEEIELRKDFKNEDEIMDKMRDNVKIKSEELEEQRLLFYKELQIVQTMLYEKEMNKKSFKEVDIPIGEFSMICLKKREEEKSEKTDFASKLEKETNQKIEEMRKEFEEEKRKKIMEAKKDFKEKEKTVKKLVQRISNMKKKFESISGRPYKEML